MNSLSKKLSLAILTVISAICLGLTVVFGLTETAVADDIKQLGTTDLIITDGTLTGLTSSAETAVGGKGGNEFAITIPSTVTMIGGSAFNGYTNLTAVYFENAQFSELTIESYAFKETGLKYIEFPDTRIIIRQSAFENCAGLNSMYLPKYSADNVLESSMFGTAIGRHIPILIAPSANDYDKYADYFVSSDFLAKLAYKMTVKLVYGGETHYDYRLFSFNSVDSVLDYTYVLQEDGKTWTSGGSMPVQDGYGVSVWYSDSEYKYKIDEKAFGSMLNGILGSGDEISLYAKTVDIDASDRNLTYINAEISIDEALKLTAELSQICNVSLTEYAPYIGDSIENPQTIKNAGTYTAELTLKEERNDNGSIEYPYGQWAEPLKIKVIVSPAEIKGADLEWVSIIDDGNSYTALAPSSPEYIFVYTENGVRVPYFEPDNSKGTPSIVSVTNSYLIYSGKEYTVALRKDGDYSFSGEDGYFDVTYSNGCSATDAGEYAATATIKSNNYVINNKHISIDPDNYSAAVTKVWYVIEPTENSLRDEGGAAYTVPSEWEYGEDILKTPYATFGGAVTFRLECLSDNGFKTVESTQSLFKRDVKPSEMFAGDYRLTVYVGASGNFDEFEEVFEFTVKNRVYEKLNELQIEDYKEAKYTLPASYGFAEIAGWDEWSAANPDFELSFRIISFNGDSKEYYTEAQYKGSMSGYAPKEVGVYTIFYRISAVGYVPRTGSFTYVIYKELSLEDIQSAVNGAGAVYTGSPVKPNLDANEYYAVYLDNANDPEVKAAMSALGIGSTVSYVEKGSYAVAVALRDTYLVANTGTYLYRFVDEDGNCDPAQKYAKVILEIKEAARLQFAIDIEGWEYGNFSEDKVIIISYDSVRLNTSDFKLTINGKTKEEFNSLPAAWYSLTATYLWGDGSETVTVPVRIEAATIVWENEPVIENWTYGNFKTGYVAPEPTMAERFSLIEKNVLENADFLVIGSGNQIIKRTHSIQDLLDENGELPAGDYRLSYSYTTPSGSNYKNFEWTVYFTVEKAENYFTNPPVLNGWEYGDESIDYFTYSPEFTLIYTEADNAPDVEFRILSEYGTVLGTGKTLADLELDEYANLNVGLYEVIITVPEYANYYGFTYTKQFEVTKAKNGWEEVPSVSGWTKGKITDFADVLTAVPKLGTLFVTITDKNGKAIVEDELPENINVNVLKSLGEGNYVLKAYVEGSDSYDELVAYVDFTVLGTGTLQTVLIIVSIILALIAIVLAVIAIRLSSLRKKAAKSNGGAQNTAKSKASQAPKQRPAQQPMQQPQQRPAQQPMQPQQRPAQQPMQPQQRPVQQPTQQAQQRPMQQPTQQAQQRPMQQPMQQAQQRPVQQPMQQPQQRPAQQPMQQPQQRPAQQPMQQPQQRPAQQSMQQPQQRPMQQPTQQPQQRPVQQPMQQPQQRPVQQPMQQPQQRPAQQPPVNTDKQNKTE